MIFSGSVSWLGFNKSRSFWHEVNAKDNSPIAIAQNVLVLIAV